MDLLVERVDVWAATVPDKPGGLAATLDALQQAGANLQFVVARRAPESPGHGVIFVTPLQNGREIRAASQVGFNVAQSQHAIRIFGRDRPGIAAELTSRMAEGGINLRGFSASVIGHQFVAYVAVDSQADADRAMRLLGEV